jgi:tRNA(Ile)-lysidine synthase
MAGRPGQVTSFLHQRVRRTIRRHALLPPGSRVLIGLSGGSDSVALTRLLLDLAEHGEFVVSGLAHLNHALRPTAVRDQEFCERLAARLRLPFVTERADVREYAEANGLSVEDAARRLRYAFLERAAEGLRADRIAVGHTQDDQAETFLLKLMRGAGLSGLAGIHPRRGAVIRPLLEVCDRDLQAFLALEGESWVEDETNADLANPRNRVRHRVLPELDQASGGPTLAAIARAAELIREDGQWLDQVAEERFPTVATVAAWGIELDVPVATGLPAPILRRVLLRALRGVAGGREVGLEHVESVLGLLAKGAGGVDLPGSRAEFRGAKVVLLGQKGSPK